VKVDTRALENDGYKGVSSATGRVINALASPPGGIPRGPIYRGG
jgi:hypothetical protein